MKYTKFVDKYVNNCVDNSGNKHSANKWRV
jgi:hypothetical protein